MALPARQPLGDRFEGYVLRTPQGRLALADAALTGDIVARGSLIVRYAIPYLGKPHLMIVPGLVALDYGEMLTGDEAWEFLLRRSNLYPRADVVGYRNDGVDDMIAVKWLDLAQPIRVLVFADEQAAEPVAQPSALIAADTRLIAPRLLEYLPHYVTLADWEPHE